MAMTVAELMAAARDIADAADTTRWPDATVETWLGVVHWREWANVLNANNEYRMNQVLPTEDSDGRFLKTDLNSGAGDAKKWWYRILSLSDGQQYYYRQVRYQDYPAPQSPTILPYVWYEYGDYIQMLPAVAGNVVTATVNWRPTRADQLSSTASTVDFPEDGLMILAYGTARHLAMKGGIETEQSLQYAEMATALREEFLMDLRRAGKDPTRFRAPDSAMDWGGV